MYILDGVVVVKNPYENKCFIYSKNQRVKYEINEDMFGLLAYINKNEFLNQTMLEDEYEGIEDVLDYLIDNQLITEEATDNKYCIKDINEINAARIFIECTDECNLSCPHCYGEFGNKKRKNLSVSSIENLLKKAVDLGVYEVDITGGEPFMHPMIESIFDMLHKYGMITTLFTNLTLCDEDKIKMIKDYGITTVVTSIESANENIHDSFRGVTGSLKRTVKNIKWLIENGVEVKVNYVLGNHNIDDAQYNIDYICSLGVCCNIDVTTPEGRAASDSIDLKKALAILKKYNDNSIAQNCGVGRRMIFVSSDGTIYPCPSLQESEFSIGNIYEEYNLKQCFETMFNMFTKSNCNDNCSVKACSGGCRARAFHLTGNIGGVDPYYCGVFEREKYV